MSKKFLFFVLLGILLVFGGLYSAVWVQWCPLRHVPMHDLQEDVCAMLYPPVTSSGDELSTLFGLMVLGLFLLIGITTISKGFAFPLLKPPQFQC
jgi:hypothetical protein